MASRVAEEGGSVKKTIRSKELNRLRKTAKGIEIDEKDGVKEEKVDGRRDGRRGRIQWREG